MAADHGERGLPSGRLMSREAEPGDVVVYASPHMQDLAVLDRRKDDDSGWWVLEGGGYADYVLDAQDNHIIIRRADLLAVLTRYPSPLSARSAEPCALCEQFAKTGGPPHEASPGCESGRRPHCSCDRCW